MSYIHYNRRYYTCLLTLYAESRRGAGNRHRKVFCQRGVARTNSTHAGGLAPFGEVSCGSDGNDNCHIEFRIILLHVSCTVLLAKSEDHG